MGLRCGPIYARLYPHSSQPVVAKTLPLRSDGVVLEVPDVRKATADVLVI